MKRALFWLALGAWWLSPVAIAETLYVTDQVTVGLRADAASDAPVLATVSTGAALEVLERSGTSVRVRNANGVEGWIESSALATQPPAAQRLKALRAEFDRTRAQLANTEGLLQKSRAAASPDVDKIQNELAAVRAQLGKAEGEIKKRDEAIKKKDDEIAAATAARDAARAEAQTLREGAAHPVPPPPSAGSPAPAEPMSVPQTPLAGFSFLWLGIAFAMLVIGFIGGIVWVKESIRRRMGGMYLRI